MMTFSLLPRLLLGGDPPAPTANESTAAQLAAYTNHLPGLLNVTNQQILPNELAQLAASQAVSPQYAALQQQIYDTIGRQMNRTGQDIARENALSQAGTDAAVLAGPGQEVARRSLELDKITDPEYYQTRELLAKRLEEFAKPGLSGGETEAITRGLNRQNVGRGVNNVPSQTNIVSNAMTFGNAARDRLGQALGALTGALPGMRSGVDTFGRVTGKIGTFNNTGDARFMGARQGAGEQIQGLSNNLLSQTGENQRTGMNINANRRDTLDRTIQGFKAFGQTAGSLAKAAF